MVVLTNSSVRNSKLYNTVYQIPGTDRIINRPPTLELTILSYPFLFVGINTENP